MLTVSVHTNPRDLSGLKSVWERLSLADQQSTLFNSYCWTESWIHCFWQKQYSLQVTVIYSGQDPVALLPLYYNTDNNRWMLLATGEPEAEEIATEYCDFLLDSSFSDPDVVQKKILDSLKPLAKKGFIFRNCLASSHVLKIASQLKRSISRETGNTFQVSCEQSFDQLLTTFSKNHRKKTREILNRFHGKAGLTFHSPDPSNFESNWEILRNLHTSDWVARGKTGAFSADSFNAFHDYLQKNHPQARPLFAMLSCDGEPVAINVYYQSDNRLHFYQSGSNKGQFGSLSPGILLHTLCIRFYCGQPVVYDFMRGSLKATYKEKFSSRGEAFYDIEIFGAGPGQRLRFWAVRAKRMINRHRG